jgi:hypothetical protein
MMAVADERPIAKAPGLSRGFALIYRAGRMHPPGAPETAYRRNQSRSMFCSRIGALPTLQLPRRSANRGDTLPIAPVSWVRHDAPWHASGASSSRAFRIEVAGSTDHPGLPLGISACLSGTRQ